jgi:hypothetical protein
LPFDNLQSADKFRNLADCEIEDYLDKRDFIERIAANQFDEGVEAVLTRAHARTRCTRTAAT